MKEDFAEAKCLLLGIKAKIINSEVGLNDPTIILVFDISRFSVGHSLMLYILDLCSDENFIIFI